VSSPRAPEPSRHARVKQLLEQASSLVESARVALFDAQCVGDPDLRHEVESLLAFHASADDDFLEGGRPACFGSEAAALEPGHVHAGRYRIESLLGEGGVGRVYRAWDQLLDLPVALKTLRVVSSAQHRRLLQEARLARMVTHPVACRVYDVGEHDGELFLTMEQVKGEDLASLLARDGRLPPSRVARIGIALCEGLAAAHQAGVLHRDLKPANVIVEPSGAVRIVDFGLAASRPRAAGAGLPLGSPAYMAPEQAPPGGEIGPGADLHGVGLILHEALTGRRVFEAPTSIKLFEDLKTRVPPRPSASAEGVDPLLDAIIVQALEKDPRARPASAEAMARTLRASLEADPSHHGSARPQLPRALTSFVGRRRELEDTAAHLAEPGLVTLIGPGGAGKSRVALAAARTALTDFGDRLALVELGGLTRAEDVPHEVARVLGLDQVHTHDVDPQLRQRLGGRPFLLVLDNCEHLGEACAKLVRRLLEDVPRLSILATSRAPLCVDGERCLGVGPLSVPALGSDEVPLQHDGVRLFVERAKAVVPGFEAGPENIESIVRLCRGLDGLPLALELAAARLRALSLEELVSRLDRRFEVLTSRDRSAPAHHRSLRALIDWSHDELTEPGQVLFRRLAVFAGSFTLESAERVCSTEGLEPERVVELLADLVDHSLVLVARKSGQVRYHLLESLRAYGRDRLAAAGEVESLRRAHLEHFADSFAKLEGGLAGGARTPELEALVEDLPDVRTALDFGATDAAAARLGLALATGIARTGTHGARRAELRRPLETMLEIEGLDAPAQESEARSLLSHLAREAGDHELALAQAERARALGEEAGDAALQSEAARSLAAVLSTEASVAEALEKAREALDLAIAAGDPRQQAACHVGVGKVTLMSGDRDEALREFHRALDLLAETPNLLAEAVVLGNIGAVEMERDNLDVAQDYIERSAAVARELGDPTCLLRASINLACCMRGRDEHSDAIDLLRVEALRAREMANGEAECVCHLNLVGCWQSLGDRERALSSGRDGLRLSRDMGWQPQTLQLIEHVAQLAGECGFPEQAARTLSAVESQRAQTGQVPLEGWSAGEESLAGLRERLDQEVWQEQVAAGQLLGPAETLQAALDLVDEALN